MNFYEKWVDLDLNPIISFNSDGKITFSNSEAQYLLSRIKQSELFNLAVKYASKTYGVNTSYINLSIKNYIFYAITVTYENDEEVHMKLYKSAMVKKESKLNIKNTNKTNIFTIIDLAISTNKIKNSIEFIKNYDPSIPDFKLNANEFVKTINKVLDIYSQNATTITCSVLLKVGEYIKIEGKKYSLISVKIQTDKKIDFEELKKEQNYSTFILSFEDDKVIIDLPLISS
ncbi:MAG: hypothetical protein ACQERD_01645 [Campylobacterota bacterium]